MVLEAIPTICVVRSIRSVSCVLGSVLNVLTNQDFLEQVQADAWSAVMYTIFLLFSVVVCFKVFDKLSVDPKTNKAGKDFSAFLIIFLVCGIVYNINNAIHYFVAPQYEATQRMRLVGND
jgi:multisubunit Na+/H+ antiporter MnhG subunit